MNQRTECGSRPSSSTCSGKTHRLPEWPGGRPAAAADHDAGVALLALVIKAVAIRVKREDLAGVNPMAAPGD